jgi:glycerophosphoryl diester phosphodiesterase
MGPPDDPNTPDYADDAMPRVGGMAAPHVLISAHRCGGAVDPAYDNTPAGVEYAASIGADYVEFDVRRAGDGTLVCSHDPVRDPTETSVPGLDEVLATVAECGLGAHVDLKGHDVHEWAEDRALNARA